MNANFSKNGCNLLTALKCRQNKFNAACNGTDGISWKQEIVPWFAQVALEFYITTKITWELVLFGKDSIPLFYWIVSALKPVGANIRIEHINSDS